MGFGIGMALISSFTIIERSEALNGLADDIYKKDLIFDNKLTHQKNSLKADSESLLYLFFEFSRGGHKNVIKEMLYGHRDELNGEPYDYGVYHYHYVDQSKRIGSKGKTETVYHYYDRYGVVIDFGYASSLLISGSHPGKSFSDTYKTGSVAFNKVFYVTTDNEFVASRFLKPAVIVELEDLAKKLPKLNIEINSIGQLCIFLMPG
jgi:hypothetical protein